MKHKLKNYTTLLFKLVKTLVSFMTLFCVILIILYISGNFQGFLDSTQLLILKVTSISAIFLGICAFLGILISISFIYGDKTTNKKRGILYIIGMFFLIIFSLVIITISTTLEYLSKGL